MSCKSSGKKKMKKKKIRRGTETSGMKATEKHAACLCLDICILRMPRKTCTDVCTVDKYSISYLASP